MAENAPAEPRYADWPEGPAEPPAAAERDHAQDVLRLRRRILALEELIDRSERMRGVIIPKTLTAELDKTARWVHAIFVDYGFDIDDGPVVVAGGGGTENGVPA